MRFTLRLIRDDVENYWELRDEEWGHVVSRYAEHDADVARADRDRLESSMGWSN